MREKTRIQDMSRRIAVELGFRKGDVLKVLKKFTQEIVVEVYEGKSITLPRFGTFVAYRCGARKARNVYTGESIIVAPRTMLKFRPYRQWKDSIKYEKYKAELAKNASSVLQDSEDASS